MKLNDSQYKATISSGPIVCVTAGAGSGKTRVLTSTVERMLNDGVSPSDILLITFTNKAANEMKERINNNDIMACTIHSFCVKLLRKYKGKFIIWDDDDYNKAMDMVEKKLSLEISAKYRKQIQYNIDAMLPMGKLNSIYSLYDKYRGQSKAYDFTSLLLGAYNLLKDDRVRQEVTSQYKYILVDEYQDVSRLQHEIVKLLYSNYLFVVGDPWQSIYGFRAGSPEFLEEWMDNPESDNITLDVNYRNSWQINNISESMMGKRRVKQCLHDGNSIITRKCYDQFAEVDHIINKYLINKGGKELSNTAVLYRTRKYTGILEHKMHEYGIPYVMKGSYNVARYKLTKDIMAYLRLSENIEDDTAFLRVVKNVKGFGQKKIDDIMSLSPISKTAKDRYPKLVTPLFDLIKNISDTLSSAGKIKELLKVYQVEDKETLESLMLIAERYVNLEDFMDYITLIGEAGKEANVGVNLMTIHASKGLEFDNVIILGGEEGHMPMRNADEDEERRIMYVAITRARNNVDILYNGILSRFITGLQQRIAA